jgi:FlaA1/EpsC-like NDP-sugar epimerase
LFEELLNENEVHPEQVFPKIFIGKAALIDQKVLQQFMEQFPNMRSEEVRDQLLDIANNRLSIFSDHQTAINYS